VQSYVSMSILAPETDVRCGTPASRCSIIFQNTGN
jgi:hypothetical protein